VRACAQGGQGGSVEAGRGTVKDRASREQPGAGKAFPFPHVRLQTTTSERENKGTSFRRTGVALALGTRVRVRINPCPCPYAHVSTQPTQPSPMPPCPKSPPRCAACYASGQPQRAPLLASVPLRWVRAGGTRRGKVVRAFGAEPPRPPSLSLPLRLPCCVALRCVACEPLPTHLPSPALMSCHVMAVHTMPVHRQPCVRHPPSPFPSP
jgi:hypothetical protein